MAQQFYRQCSLVKGSTGQVAWIPESLSVVGGCVRIGDDDGWLVGEVESVS